MVACLGCRDRADALRLEGGARPLHRGDRREAVDAKRGGLPALEEARKAARGIVRPRPAGEVRILLHQARDVPRLLHAVEDVGAGAVGGGAAAEAEAALAQRHQPLEMGAAGGPAPPEITTGAR